MRITNSMATQRAIAEFATARQQMEAAQTRVTSGKQFQTAGENPLGTMGVMQNTAQMRAIDQYQRNIGAASQRSSMEEGALDEMTSLLTRARELAISQSTDTASAATRQAAGAEVNQLLAHAVQLANTRSGDEYLFGGDYPGTAPFTLDTTAPAYTFSAATPAPSGPRRMEIGAGQLIVANHDGTQVFGTAAMGPLKALQDLAAAMQTGTTAAVAATLPTFVTETAKVQTLLAETGARANRLDMTQANLTALKNQLTTFNSNIQDIDIETAVTELTGRQVAYQAAMASTTRMMSMTLTDYLR